MRISKTVREYIEREVQTRLAPKYEIEKAEAERQERIRQEIIDKINSTTTELIHQMGKEAIEANSFLEPIYLDNFSVSVSRCFGFKDRAYISSVYNWKLRLEAEAKEIIDNIVVELELGGTKADLERLLAQVGK